jgi:hypothetical protein
MSFFLSISNCAVLSLHTKLINFHLCQISSSCLNSTTWPICWLGYHRHRLFCWSIVSLLKCPHVSIGLFYISLHMLCRHCGYILCPFHTKFSANCLLYWAYMHWFTPLRMSCSQYGSKRSAHDSLNCYYTLLYSPPTANISLCIMEVRTWTAKAWPGAKIG